MAGKTIIVTGAGSGVGRATALAFLAGGWNVALAGRHLTTLTATVAAAGSKGHALPVATDVTDETAVARLFAACVEKFGRVDALFNNAGTGAPAKPLEDLTLAEWQHVVDVNLTGMFLCLREAFRVMQAQAPQGGRIINNGSISATTPRPNSIPYTATKHAVTGLTKSAALDGRKYHIAVGQIDIGNAATALTANMAAGILQADGSVRAEPRMDVDDVARSVLYMASLPLESNVLFHTIMATDMPFVGRG